MTDAADELARIAERYARFAADEAHGECEIYEKLASAVAGSEELLAFLAGLPADRRQPNLFLAAVRQLCGVPDDAGRLIQFVRRQPEHIREVMLSHTTQTNEPARCSVLLPLLAQLPQPLALLEVGASAGLCLLPEIAAESVAVTSFASMIADWADALDALAVGIARTRVNLRRFLHTRESGVQGR